MNSAMAIFLDRDGVINKPRIKNGVPHPPNNLDELIIYPNTKQLLCRLKKLNFFLVVVTNQPDVARGTTDIQTVNKINDAINAQLPIDLMLTCVHDDVDSCNCRKPKIGMFLEAQSLLKLQLSNCYMIGDRWKDMQAGLDASCKTIFIDRQYSEQRPTSMDHSVYELSEAVDIIEENSVAKN